MFAHVPIAIGIQLICWRIGHLLDAPSKAAVWIGCFAATAVCVMREITQAEYRWIERFGGGNRANMPSYAGLELWEWNAHSLYETLVAALASVILAAVVTWRT